MKLGVGVEVGQGGGDKESGRTDSGIEHTLPLSFKAMVPTWHLTACLQ